MSSKVQFAGIDVDDKNYHVSIYDPQKDEHSWFKSTPNPSVLIKRLNGLKVKARIKLCYEASYIGNSLCRELIEAGYDCTIVAPSLIPVESGRAQKTDRLDCQKLAKFFSMGLLTAVNMPTEQDEANRDLIRSRKFLVAQLTRVQNHINGLCRRLGRNYLQETNKKSRWTKHHLNWLQTVSANCSQSSNKFSLRVLLKQHEELIENIGLYDTEIDNIAEQKAYKDKVKALECFKGISTVGALTLVTEIGDVARFEHPRRLMSFAGFDIREYSSGGKQRHYGISKMGNKRIRTVAVESCLFALNPPVASTLLKRRRVGASEQAIKIADKCMQRLHKKGTRLLYAGKHKKKIQTALGREFLGFVWEVMRLAA